ncbi:serine--tRNA ligase, mitochondrial [Lutzomyia longipalpis]|uniref:serine--tRNA ligase, mitochondrial n=1 Tax=Lutzomyia longipalpis TaxID=7200 RepID=UPI002483A489|nr:serine--tRNA ligase, mitochondrial [Lutzomyia longipalpis]
MQLINKCLILPNLYYQLQRYFTTFHGSAVKISNIVPEFNLSYLLNPENTQKIAENIARRKNVGDIEKVHELARKLSHGTAEESTTKKQLEEELYKIPNDTHPDVINYGDEPKIVQFVNEKRSFPFKALQFAELCRKNNLLRMENLGNFSGHKSYYLLGDLAEFEQALLQFTVDRLSNYNFELISVPDIVPSQIIEGCGFSTTGERNQVYKLDQSPLCLSGTAEMSLAAYFAGKSLPIESLPIKVMAVSRCYRAEVSGLQEERGIYRVHQFSKVEMFGVAQPIKSSELLEEFRHIQMELFKELGLHFQILDMPPVELGAPAYRKYDIEALLASRGNYGEISSCSNCTDYQARRLAIKTSSGEFPHTVNGTACAVPRMLIAILESFQNADGTICVPDALRPYVSFEKMSRRKTIPQTKLVKKIDNPNFVG